MKNSVNPIIAYCSSTLLMAVIFLATSLRHYGVIDYQYFFKMLPIMLGLSLVPVVVVWILKTKKWYFSIGLGALVGLLSAVVYVQYVNNI